MLVGALAATASVDRQALIPMVVGYLILMAALGLGLLRLYRPHRPHAGPGPPGSGGQAADPAQAGPGADSRSSPPGAGRAAFIRRVVGTVVGGYLLLLAVDVAYYYAVARVAHHFLESAVTGPALLVGLAAPVFAAASWLTERLRRRHDRAADTDSHHPARIGPRGK